MSRAANAIVTDVAGGPDLAAVRTLFREYGAEVSRVYCLTGFEEELAGLPGRYVPPSGCLLLLRVSGAPAGVVAMRPLADGIAEMKRLYIRGGFQRRGSGRRLAGMVIERARQAGCRALRLDTLEHMTSAQKLYRSMGFADIPAYHADAVPGMRFMELVL